MAARKRLRVEKWPLGKQPTVWQRLCWENGAKCGKDGGALRHYWYHVNGSWVQQQMKVCRPWGKCFLWGLCWCKLSESPQISISASFWQSNLVWLHKRKTTPASRKHLLTRSPSWNQGPATGPTTWPPAQVLEPLEAYGQLHILSAGPDSAWGRKNGVQGPHRSPSDLESTPWVPLPA